jgi:hypothetical protein
LALGDEAYSAGLAKRRYFYAAEAWVEAVESAVALGDLDDAREPITELDARPPVELNGYLTAHRARLGARIHALGGAEGFEGAVALFREIGARFWLGVTLLERSESMRTADDDEAAAPVLAEATSIFGEIGARPWLERAHALAGVAVSRA